MPALPKILLKGDTLFVNGEEVKVGWTFARRPNLGEAEVNGFYRVDDINSKYISLSYYSFVSGNTFTSDFASYIHHSHQHSSGTYGYNLSRVEFGPFLEDFYSATSLDESMRISSYLRNLDARPGNQHVLQQRDSAHEEVLTMIEKIRATGVTGDDQVFGLLDVILSYHKKDEEI